MIPCYEEYSVITHQKNEIEHCATIIYPNHNANDKLAVVGIYRPPYKEHPSYKGAIQQMMGMRKKEQITTILIGDLNLNSWLEKEKEEYVDWIEEEQLWELSDPRTPTYRTGTVTDGILLAMGDYMPDGILPQETEPEIDGGHPEVYPVVVSPNPELADRHLLYLDLQTIEQTTMPKIEKYNLNVLSEEEWIALDQKISSDTKYSS